MSEPINFFRQGLDDAGLATAFNKQFEHLKSSASVFGPREQEELMFLLVHTGSYLETYSTNDAERELMSKFFLSQVARYSYVCGVRERPYVVPILKMCLRIFEKTPEITTNIKQSVVTFGESLFDNRNLFPLNSFTTDLLKLPHTRSRFQLMDLFYKQGNLAIEDYVNPNLCEQLDDYTKIYVLSEVFDGMSQRLARLYPSSEFNAYRQFKWLISSFEQVKHLETDIPFKILSFRPLIIQYNTIEPGEAFSALIQDLDAIGYYTYGTKFDQLLSCSEGLGLGRDVNYWKTPKLV